jgi:hypothetical protein
MGFCIELPTLSDIAQPQLRVRVGSSHAEPRTPTWNTMISCL